MGIVFYLVLSSTVAIGARATAESQQPDTTPRLVIESGGHLAVIRTLIFSADGHELVSVSDDKTIRVWSISADGRHSVLDRTIRGQVEDGRGGQLAAAALSPANPGERHLWLAVGGYLAGTEEDRNAIRIHDYATGNIRALLRGHADNILALAFSPSGHWLASAGKDKTIRIWSMPTSSGAEFDNTPLVIDAHTDRITGLAWSPAGDRLASASYDGTAGLWDVQRLDSGKVSLVARLQGHEGKVRSVAFHPHEAALVSGGEDGWLRLWDPGSGSFRGILAGAGQQISVVAFSQDGRLIAAGNFTPPRPRSMPVFDYPSGKMHVHFEGHDNLTAAVVFHPGSRWLASGGGDHKEILLWNVDDGKIMSRLESAGQTINAVALSKDGLFLSWGHRSDFSSVNNRGPLEHRFHLKALERMKGGLPQSLATRAQERAGELSIEPEFEGLGQNSSRLHVYRGDRRLGTIARGPSNGYWHSAWTFTPDGRYVLSGGNNGELCLFTPDAALRGRLVGHTGEITALAVSVDGRWALSGSNDQTLKLWDLNLVFAHGQAMIGPSLTLFPTTDGEWIAWTPEGYFAASERGPHMVGYLMNRGISKTAEYVSIDQLYERFYRPDLVFTKLHGDPQALWKQKEASADIKATISNGIAPQVAIIDPSRSTSVDGMEVDVHARIEDKGGGIGKVIWKINETTIAAETFGEPPFARLAVSKSPAKQLPQITLSKQLALLPGENKIELVVYNSKNEIASIPAAVTITARPTLHKAETPTEPLPPLGTKKEKDGISSAVPAPAVNQTSAPAYPSVKTAPTPSTAITPDVAPSPDAAAALAVSPAPAVVPSVSSPTLHLMVVGINDYRDKSLRLKYAVQDGKDLIDTIQRTSRPLFEEVKVVGIFDEHATLAGLDAAFKQVRSSIAPQDVFIFYLAGHGVTLGGRYYFLPQDFRYYNDDAVREMAINQDHIQGWLAGIRARKSLILIDTCESGSFSQSLVAMRGMAEKAAVAKLTRATGRATIVASTDKQPAAEGYKGHGVFTYALLQGFRRADLEFGNRDGLTGLFELAAFVNDQVPAITMNAFNYEQIPQVHMVGTDFPIGVATTPTS